MLLVTAETSHVPIGPCGPLEQSEDSFRHVAMADCISSLDVGVHAVVGHYQSGYTVAVRVGVRLMIRVTIRVRIRVRAVAGR